MEKLNRANEVLNNLIYCIPYWEMSDSEFNEIIEELEEWEAV